MRCDAWAIVSIRKATASHVSIDETELWYDRMCILTLAMQFSQTHE